MDATLQQVETVDYPTIEFNGESFPIKFTCQTLLQLKKEGIDLFAQRPYDAHFNEALRLGVEVSKIALTESADVTDEDRAASAEKRARRMAIVALSDAEHALASPEARDFASPMLSKDFTTNLETALKIGAVIISNTNPTGMFPVEDLARHFEPAEIVGKVRAAIKKVWSLTANA